MPPESRCNLLMFSGEANIGQLFKLPIKIGILPGADKNYGLIISKALCMPEAMTSAVWCAPTFEYRLPVIVVLLATKR